MTIISGIGEFLAVGKYDLSGDVGSFSSINDSRNLQDISTLHNLAVGRLTLLRDGSLSFSAFFDPAAGGSHPVLSALPGTDTIATWASGSVAGMPTASLKGLQSTYNPTRGQDGSLVVTTDLMGDGTGLDWGQILTTGKQTFASAGAGPVVDNGAATTRGFAAYLHAISLGSGTATVAIQDSSDNISYGNVTGGVFTAVTAGTSERIGTGLAATVKRYTKVNVTGTFTNLVAFVTVVRYPQS